MANIARTCRARRTEDGEYTTWRAADEGDEEEGDEEVRRAEY